MSLRRAAALAIVIAFMSTAPAPALSQAPATVDLESEHLGESVRLAIQLPADYAESDRSYPVLYLLGGEFFMQQAVAVVEFLARPAYMNPVIPQSIIVGITTSDRNRFYTPTHDAEYDGMAFPTSGHAASFRQFLVDELRPYLDREFRTSDRRLLAGWSLGGLFAIWNALEHPGDFDGHLAISPSLWWDDEVVNAMVPARAAGMPRLTVTLGGLERAPMDESVEGGFLSAIETAGAPWGFEFIEIPGESHNSCPPVALHQGLMSLHRLLPLPESVLDGERSEVASYLVEQARNSGMAVDSAEQAGALLIKKTVAEGQYGVGMQIAELMAHRITVTPRAMVAVGEMAFRLERFEDSVAAFKEAIAREQAKDAPDPDELAFFGEYLEWIEARAH